MERQSQHPSPQGLHTYFKVYSVETKSNASIHSLMWRWSLLKTRHYCVWLELASIVLSLVFEKTLQMVKKLVKMIGCRYVCYHICWRNYSFYLRQNISNLCQSIFVFLTVYYDKIFKHWLESSSIRLRVSFFQRLIRGCSTLYEFLFLHHLRSQINTV